MTCPPPAILLAQTRLPEGWNELRNLWPTNQGTDYAALVWWIAAVGLLVLGAIVAARYRQRREQPRPFPAPLTTFLQLARALRLTLGQRWLLVRIARQQQLPTPLTLLLSPATLQHHAQAYAGTLPASRRQRLLTRIERLGQQVFGPAGA